MTKIRAIATDITTIGTDAVVNAANTQLAAGGGVCGAIFAAAGRAKLQLACNAIGGCPTGSAVDTPAFGLEAHGTRHIIHAVGPIWNPNDAATCDAQLVSAYRSSLQLAVELGARTIAIPGISTGIFHFPVGRAADLVAHLLKTETFDLDEILLVTLDPAGAKVYGDALGQA